MKPQLEGPLPSGKTTELLRRIDEMQRKIKFDGKGSQMVWTSRPELLRRMGVKLKKIGPYTYEVVA